ncbi:MAG: cytochrome c oxidase assembly protein [Verrucomicrobiota bacterium]
MQRALFFFGLLVLAGLWLGPLPRMAQHSFSAHMALHMGVVAVAAPLLALGWAGRALDPVRRWPQWFPAVPLSLVELAIVWAWHAPVLHHFARHTVVGFVCEQGAFLGAGLLVWLSVLGGDAGLRRQRAGAGVVALLLTSMHMTLLGALLALAPRPLYLHGAHAGVGALDPLDDQHLGGAIMLLVGGAAYLIGGVWLSADLVRSGIAKRKGLA